MLNKLKYFNCLKDARIDKNEFVIVNSAWLTLMDLRINGDLDIIISRKYWKKHYPEVPSNSRSGLPGECEKRLRVHPIEEGFYGKLKNIKDSDDVVYNHKVFVHGFPFVEPKLYFRYKLERMKRNKKIIDSLPWWKRNKFLSREQRKIFIKYSKDCSDFSLLKNYFTNIGHDNKDLSMISDDQWGLNDHEINSLIR